MDRHRVHIVLVEAGKSRDIEEVFPALAPYALRMAWGYRSWNTVYLMDDRNQLITLDLDSRRLSVDSANFPVEHQLGLLKFNGTSPEDMVILRYSTDRESLNPVTDIFRWSVDRFNHVARMDDKTGLLRALAPNAPLGYFGFHGGKARLFILRDGYYRPDIMPEINAMRFVLESHHKLYVGSDEGFFVVHGDGLEDVHFPACDYPWSVTPGMADDVYVACYKMGIFQVDESGRTTSHYALPGLTSRDGLGNQVLSNTLVTRHHRLWGSTTGAITLHHGESRLGHHFTRHSAEAFTLDPLDESVLIGTRDVLRFPAALDGPPDTLRLAPGLVGGGYVNDLRILPERQLWVAAPAGIECIGLGDHSTTVYAASNGRSPCIGAVTLDPDAQGNLWSGGTCGLMVLRPGSDAFEHVLPNIITHRVNQIEILPGNRLACASNNNLYLLDISGRSARLLNIYSQKNGLDLYEPSENGSCLTQDRFVWLPSVAGIQRLDLTRVPDAYAMPALKVRRINGDPVPFVADTPTVPAIMGSAALLDLMLVDHSGRNWQYQFVWPGSKPSPWQSAAELLVSGLQHGRNTITVRAAWNTADPNTFVEAAVSIDARLPVLSRRNVQATLAILTSLLALLVITSIRAARRNARRAEMLNADLYKNRLQTIQAYFNPHFLFNTLSAIQDKVLRQDAQAGNDMIIRLSRVFRKILEAGKAAEGRAAFIPLAEELSVIEDMAYLNNMQVEAPVRLVIDIPDSLRKENPLIPPMLIQPFVENAFKHAFTDESAEKMITVTCLREGPNLHISVRDNGIGPAGQSRRKGASMGMALARERMKILNELQIENDLDIRPAAPAGTEVAIRIRTNP